MMNQISNWWPADFLCLSEAKQIKLEPWAGGRLYEETEQGAQLLWSNITHLVPNETVEFVGPLSPSFGGPALNFTRLTLIDSPSGKTMFRMNNTVLGNTSEESTADTEQGWRYLYTAFKEFCERT